jgi:2-keto-4-pentenoate hydratase
VNDWRAEGSAVQARELIHPKVEPEIAFVLSMRSKDRAATLAPCWPPLTL